MKHPIDDLTLFRVQKVAALNTSSFIVVSCILLLAAGMAALGWDTPLHASKPSPMAATAPPVAHLHALDGTLYLLQYVSVRTRKGVYGFEPGCPLRLLGVNPAKGTLRVTDGNQSVEIESSLLTDDRAIADAARRDDQAAQWAAAVAQQRQRDDDQASHLELYIAQAQDAHDAEIDHNLRAGIYSRGGTLDEPARPTTWYDNR